MPAAAAATSKASPVVVPASVTKSGAQAVAQRVGDHQRHVRPGGQGEQDTGGDEREENLSQTWSRLSVARRSRAPRPRGCACRPRWERSRASPCAPRGMAMEIAHALGNAQYGAQLAAGRLGIELTAPAGILHRLLAGLVLQRLGIGNVKGNAVDLVGAERDRLVQEVAQPLHITHRQAHLVHHTVAVDGRGAAILGLRIARLDVERGGLDVLRRRCRRSSVRRSAWP